MRREHEVVRLLGGALDIWQRHFPDLHRRAEWHIVRHLCSAARQGCSAGELSGFIRQIFLLDEATVRERILTLQRRELCTVETAGASLTARSFVAPTEQLLKRFDSHLSDLAVLLAARVAAMDDAARPAIPAPIADDARRAVMLAVTDSYCGPYRAALDAIFAARGLSPARRAEARRHLISPSHWTLTLLATQHHYDTGAPTGGDGLLADRLAAQLLQRTEQNFQTTRDHLATLMEIGVLERRGGKSLHVALTQAAAAALHAAFGETAAQWPALLRQLLDIPGADLQAPREPANLPAASQAESTLRLRPGQVPGLEPTGHLLRIVEPEAARRHIPIGAMPLVIGRAAPADLLLAGAEVSRAHCRIELVEGRICVTDLASTNGTFVNGRQVHGTVPLPRGAVLAIGAYVLEYEHLRAADPAQVDAAGVDATLARRPARRNKTGNSA